MTSESATDERSISFSSRGQPSILLEGVLHIPKNVEPAPIIVLCHPQPASSDMNDTLNCALASRLAEAGYFALRFNFRGVGKSEGNKLMDVSNPWTWQARSTLRYPSLEVIQPKFV